MKNLCKKNACNEAKITSIMKWSILLLIISLIIAKLASHKQVIESTKKLEILQKEHDYSRLQKNKNKFELKN